MFLLLFRVFCQEDMWSRVYFIFVSDKPEADGFLTLLTATVKNNDSFNTWELYDVTQV